MRTIYKTKLLQDFTTLPNTLLRDVNLSYKARGMLAMILSNRDGWVVHSSWLRENGREGKEAISSGMHELEAAGYAVFANERDDLGRITAVWTFYDSPVDEHLRTQRTGRGGVGLPCAGNPADGKPGDGNPASGKPSDGNPATKKEHEQKDYVVAGAPPERSSQTNIQKPPSAVPAVVPSPSAEEERQIRGLLNFWALAHEKIHDGLKYQPKPDDEKMVRTTLKEMLKSCAYSNIPRMMYWCLLVGQPTLPGKFNPFCKCGIAKRYGVAKFCKHWLDIGLELYGDIPKWVEDGVREIYAEVTHKVA
jgi:hypothetical protein